MNRIDLSDADVFRLYCEGCNHHEIAAAMVIPLGAALAIISRSRLQYARAEVDKVPLRLSKRADG